MEISKPKKFFFSSKNFFSKSSNFVGLFMVSEARTKNQMHDKAFENKLKENAWTSIHDSASLALDRTEAGPELYAFDRVALSRHRSVRREV